MDKLNKIIKHCDGAVELAVNGHLETGDDIDDVVSMIQVSYLMEQCEYDVNVLQEMSNLDTMVRLTIFQSKNTKFLNLFHYDLDLLLDNAIKILNIK